MAPEHADAAIGAGGPGAGPVSRPKPGHSFFEALPDEVLEKVVKQVAILEEGVGNTNKMTVLSKTVLASLRRIKVPIGRLTATSARAARNRASAARASRAAWAVGLCSLEDPSSEDPLRGDLRDLQGLAELHTLEIRTGLTPDFSALGACRNLHTLGIAGAPGVRGLTGIGLCAKLRAVDVSGCRGLTDVSALAGCAALHTLDMSECRE